MYLSNYLTSLGCCQSKTVLRLWFDSKTNISLALVAEDFRVKYDVLKVAESLITTLRNKH